MWAAVSAGNIRARNAARWAACMILETPIAPVQGVCQKLQRLPMSLLPNDVMIFDGVCHLCARSVQFILDHEADATLRFMPMQSAAGERVLRELGFDPNDVKTFVLIADGKSYSRSDAAIRIARYFGGGWKLLGVVRLVPRPLRDWAYDLVARYRYRWFGRAETCMVPTPALKARFIVA